MASGSSSFFFYISLIFLYSMLMALRQQRRGMFTLATHSPNLVLYFIVFKNVRKWKLYLDLNKIAKGGRGRDGNSVKRKLLIRGTLWWYGRKGGIQGDGREASWFVVLFVILGSYSNNSLSFWSL